MKEKSLLQYGIGVFAWILAIIYFFLIVTDLIYVIKDWRIYLSFVTAAIVIAVWFVVFRILSRR
jgi:hypothetical protein